MDIFKEINELGFPRDKYVVVGGAAMVARGIKETQDVDIVVMPDLFEKCKESGWQEKLRPNGELGLKRGVVEIYLDVNEGSFNPTTEDLINRSEIINDIRFANLRDILSFKKEYGREKDKKDVELIDKYLERNESDKN